MGNRQLSQQGNQWEVHRISPQVIRLPNRQGSQQHIPRVSLRVSRQHSHLPVPQKSILENYFMTDSML